MESPSKRDNAKTILGPIGGHDLNAEWACDFLQVHLISDLGKRRQNNEDACLLHAPVTEERLRARGLLVAVADGMGGASAGEYASHKTLESLKKHYFSSTPLLRIPEALLAAVESANGIVFEEAGRNPDYAGMGTTVSALAIAGDWAYIAQVGDSRIYLLRTGHPIKQLTHDHSLVAEQIRNGIINEEEARNHSLKNLITRAVGIKDTVEVDLFAVKLEEGDSLLLCSDGLSNMVEDSVIEMFLGGEQLKESTEALVEKALEVGGHDNITVVAVRVNAAPPRTPYQQGAKIISFAPAGLMTRLREFFRLKGAS